MSYGQISAQVGISKNTVYSIVRKWTRTGSVDRLPGSGRHKISCGEQDEALVNVIQERPFTTAVQATAVTNFPGSVRTARRRIKESGLRNYAAARKTRLRPCDKEARIGFALEHLVRDNAFWNRVIFSDEKVFQSCPNGRLRVYRPRNHRYDERYIDMEDRTGRFSVNMWAWISMGSPGILLHVGERLNSDVYIRILENVMLPSVGLHFPNNNFVFQHDNCSIHRAHRVAAWLQDHGINVLDWPSRSPDLNPIENMWGLLVKHIKERRLIYQNRQQLLNAINEAWQSLPADYHRNLCLSMPRRLTKVIQLNGAMTKY